MARNFSSIINSLDTAVWEVFVENPFLIDVAKVVTWFGTGAVLIPVAVAVGVVVWWRTRDVLSAIIPWLTLQVCGVVIASMKNWTAVQRPPREFWLTTTDSFSFPSGHVGNTTALVASLVLLVYKALPHYSRTSFAVGGLVCIAMACLHVGANLKHPVNGKVEEMARTVCAAIQENKKVFCKRIHSWCFASDD